MFKNYIRVFVRQLLRQKSYAFINVFGLAIGMACCIFILMWIVNETSYDKFYADSEKIFQIMDNQTYSDGITHTFAAVPDPLAEALRTEIPEIQFASLVNWEDKYLVNVGDKSFQETGFYAESDFLHVFGLTILAGNKANALADKSSMAISKRTAIKYFGDADPINQIMRVENSMDMKVTAVFEDRPLNASLQFDVLLPYPVFKDKNSWLNNWGSNGVKCYVKLYDQNQAPVVNEKIRLLAKKNSEHAVAEFWVQQHTRHRLYNSYKDGKEAGGRIEYVQIFGVVAGFVILIACINFMNLATARSMNRAKEVGVRKVAGAQRSTLIKQFLFEACTMTMLAFVLALLLVRLLLPLFNELTQKQLAFNSFDPTALFLLLAFALLTALLSGSYPAFFLSSFRPAVVLKKSNAHSASGNLRKALVVVQFSLSVILIVGSLVVFNQIEFIRSKDLGLNKEHVLFFWTPRAAFKNMESYKTELAAFSGITSMGITNQNPLQFGSSTGLDHWPGKQEGQAILFSNNNIDESFLQTLDIKLVEGRNFNGTPADSLSIIFNEEAIRQMGLEPPVVGQQVLYGDRTCTIIGVVNDFHSTSIRYSVPPVFFTYGPEWGYTMIKVQAGQTAAAAQHVEGVYKKFNPGYPFSYDFLDQYFERQYTSDKIIGRLALCFTVVAIIISLLGLYSLAAFTAERRIKEIGIRKALGASVSELVIMMSGSFLKLIAIALVIGCPVAFYIMSDFLNKYAYHSDLSIGIFAITAVLILLVSMCTVIYQVSRASTINPSHALRSE